MAEAAKRGPPETRFRGRFIRRGSFAGYGSVRFSDRLFSRSAGDGRLRRGGSFFLFLRSIDLCAADGAEGRPFAQSGSALGAKRRRSGRRLGSFVRCGVYGKAAVNAEVCILLQGRMTFWTARHNDLPTRSGFSQAFVVLQRVQRPVYPAYRSEARGAST